MKSRTHCSSLKFKVPRFVLSLMTLLADRTGPQDFWRSYANSIDSRADKSRSSSDSIWPCDHTCNVYELCDRRYGMFLNFQAWDQTLSCWELSSLIMIDYYKLLAGPSCRPATCGLKHTEHDTLHKLNHTADTCIVLAHSLYYLLILLLFAKPDTPYRVAPAL